MALTANQRALIRQYCGWSARFFQTDSDLEQAMNGVDSDPGTEALITNPITATPPGLLADIAAIQVLIDEAILRLQASKVGSIELNGREMEQLRDIGRTRIHRLCSLLGVALREDYFASTPAPGREGGGNYIGK